MYIPSCALEQPDAGAHHVVVGLDLVQGGGIAWSNRAEMRRQTHVEEPNNVSSRIVLMAIESQPVLDRGHRTTLCNESRHR